MTDLCERWRCGIRRHTASLALPCFCVLAMLLIGGCQAFYFLTPEKTKEVKAEYGKIADKKVAVVVWADRATLDIDPKARERVCRTVTFYMRKALPEGDFIAPSDIRKLQQDTGSDWESMTNARLCEKLECDLLLRLDLLHYTTRASRTEALRKARVGATLNLYECGPTADDLAVYETEVDAEFPPAAIHGVPDMEDSDLLREAIELFGQMVARKFYDHEVSLRGRDAG